MKIVVSYPGDILIYCWFSNLFFIAHSFSRQYIYVQMGVCFLLGILLDPEKNNALFCFVSSIDFSGQHKLINAFDTQCILKANVINLIILKIYISSMEWNGLIDRHFVLGCVHQSIYSSPRFEETVLSYRHICPEIYLASVDELFIDMYFVLLLFRRHVDTMNILNKAHRISRWKI